MAYINQLEKNEIASELKKVIPSTWKWSLAIKHHSTLVLTIAAAPFCDLGEHDEKHVQVNCFYPESYFNKSALPTIKDVLAAMNKKNHNNSDSQSDYFDVGYYVGINIGKWNKPFSAKP